jgi:hypothetical protein
MAEKVMSTGVQASSTGGLQPSPSTAHRSSRSTTEKRSKHHDDLENAKLIPSILPNYILPLASMVSRDSVLHEFKYTLITVYLPKGIRVVGPQLGLIPTLKISNFNLGDRKTYVILAPHHYLMKMTGKKLNIVPQPWIKEIARSTILNVMKIPHFGRHQEVNVCVKLPLSCSHVRYLWLDRRITMDLTLIHLITGLTMQGTNLHQFYPRKTSDHSLAH